MKINCLDINELDIVRAIDFYRADHLGNYPKYLIMNYETRNLLALKKNCGFEWTYTSSYDKVEQFRGISIAICNELNTGEVEVL